jgi:hypothetical protein
MFLKGFSYVMIGALACGLVMTSIGLGQPDPGPVVPSNGEQLEPPPQKI